ncbi:hypothetical protein [Roseateles chitinivorans]|uniref:hypothetical protein n=1 Tax=Roseateles chitinivorans TaxID=2917965 RepID=UPI003D6677D4
MKDIGAGGKTMDFQGVSVSGEPVVPDLTKDVVGLLFLSHFETTSLKQRDLLLGGCEGLERARTFVGREGKEKSPT